MSLLSVSLAAGLATPADLASRLRALEPVDVRDPFVAAPASPNLTRTDIRIPDSVLRRHGLHFARHTRAGDAWQVDLVRVTAGGEVGGRAGLLALPSVDDAWAWYAERRRRRHAAALPPDIAIGDMSCGVHEPTSGLTDILAVKDNVLIEVTETPLVAYRIAAALQTVVAGSRVVRDAAEVPRILLDVTAIHRVGRIPPPCPASRVRSDIGRPPGSIVYLTEPENGAVFPAGTSAIDAAGVVECPDVHEVVINGVPAVVVDGRFHAVVPLTQDLQKVEVSYGAYTDLVAVCREVD